MKTYLQFGTELAQKAGVIMLKYFTTELKSEWKEDNTPVTVADFSVNKLVIESILKEYPTHGILGEEESFMQDSEYIWVCDPIDGTIPFSHGIPTFTFSLALTHNGLPIVGIVYDPIMKRLFTAEKSKGAFLNGKSIKVSQSSILAQQVLAMDIMNTEIISSEVLRSEVIKKRLRIFAPGSFTYAGIMVAKGEFIAAGFTKNTAWDGAAIKILIDEAGGKTTDLYGNKQRYDRPIKGFVGSNGLIHDELIEILQKTLLHK